MSKMPTEPVRHVLNGPTMGTRWSATFFAPPGVRLELVRSALQAAVDEVDAQMSTWKPDSALMRLNASQVGQWLAVPDGLLQVLQLGLAIGRMSEGAFDIGMGDAVTAWGFGPETASAARIRDAMYAPRTPSHDAIEIDGATGRARRLAPVTLDLNGIAKGFGVDRLIETLEGLRIRSALAGIDGEMRALGPRPDGESWAIAIEEPDPERRAAHSVLALHDGAVATSGDYRHHVEVSGRRLSHTMHPRRGAPTPTPPASVTVVAATCAEADAWATALMVLGPEAGASLARREGLDALFLLRNGEKEIAAKGVGALFSRVPVSVARPEWLEC